MIKNRRTYDALKNKLARSVDRWRINRGISKLEFARQLKISPQDLRKMLKAEYGMSMGRMFDVCVILEITPNDLFGWHKPLIGKQNEIPT